MLSGPAPFGKAVGVHRIGSLLIAVILALVVAPIASAQTPGAYFTATGHTLTDEQGFFGFWQSREGARLLGAPVTQPFPVEGVGTVQYFERGRLEQVIDPASGATSIRTGTVASEYVGELLRSFPPIPQRSAAAGALYFEETRHSLREPFLSFWNAAGGAEFFGRPISEALWEETPRGQRKVQYFERARLERDADMAGTPDEIQVADLGRALALMHGLDTAPVANPGFQSIDQPTSLPNLAALVEMSRRDVPAVETPRRDVSTAPARDVSTDPARDSTAPARDVSTAPARDVASAPVAASGRRIVVDLSDQWLYAYENGAVVFDAPVATGRDGMNTPPGNFSIYAKIPVQTMDGVTDGEYWRVPDVPHVMYIYGGVALHGTYWHNLFGSGARPSHGCVNLPLSAAKWLYGWASVGTPVRVVA